MENCAEHMDGGIEDDGFSILREGAEEEYACHSAASIRVGKVGGIQLDIQYHVRGMTSSFGIGMGCHVIIAWIIPMFCQLCLLICLLLG